MRLLFDIWREKYGVSYPMDDGGEEEARRFITFSETLATVLAHNKKTFGGEHSSEAGGDNSRYALGLNRFADMTWCALVLRL